MISASFIPHGERDGLGTTRVNASGVPHEEAKLLWEGMGFIRDMSQNDGKHGLDVKGSQDLGKNAISHRSTV